MKEILAPIMSACFAFLIGYLSFRTKTKENKVTESTAILKAYNDLIRVHDAEFVRKDKEIERLGDEVEEIRQEFRRAKIAWAKKLKEING